MKNKWIYTSKYYIVFVCLFVSAVLTKSPPQDDAIGTNEVKVPFVNKETLSSGNPVA